MKKIYKITSIIIIGILMASCKDTSNKITSNTSTEIILTEQDKEKDKDEIAKILVYKALLEEVKKAEFTEEELKNIQIAQNQIKINYFIEREIKSKIQITDEEVMEFYKKYKKNFDVKPLEEVLPMLYQNLAIEKYNQAQINYYDNVIQKYKLNEILKKEGIIKSEENEKIDGKEIEKIGQ